ncbi:helix-turn-helix and ligand-binding sensor domain-containing protein [Salegentibacter sediminis]|uniref:helix-turn-helix and ligand-binding sensor domain-containing protein n=1 Tax=Salegentibacter sediminis TaxID=1930251 RepID=UPI0018E3B76C|nr:triple tyrosine motif-containing protein [Salegentibacter sediminis]
MRKSPLVSHYSQQDFQGDTQFWTTTEDHRGVSYFGNNDGVVIFDGERWHKVSLPNHSSVRSLITSSEGKVYAGGFNELGIIEKQATGDYIYRSLLKDLDLEGIELENLWQVHEYKDYIIFRSFNELIAVSGNTATHIAANNSFVHSGIVNNRFFVQDSDFGIMEFNPEEMRLSRVFDFRRGSVVGFLPSGLQNEVMAITKAGSIFKMNLKNNEVYLWKQVFDKENQGQVISAIKFENDYLLGTLSSKIIVLSENGYINRNPPAFKDISDSSILNLFKAGSGLWVLLNNGLSFVDFDSPVSQLFDVGSVYDLYIDTDRIYLATNKGVYYSKLQEGEIDKSMLQFKSIPHLEGQAWSISNLNGSLIVSHDRGLFLLDGLKASQIGEVSGFWKVVGIPDSPYTYIASNYNGIYLLKNNGSQWELQSKIKGFDESSRDILISDNPNTFWVCHGYQGVYKLKLTEDYSRVYAVDHFTDRNGLISPFNVNVTRWNDDLVFTSNTGIYEFDEASNSFKPYEKLNAVLDSTVNTRKLIQNKDTAWIVQDNEVGFIDFSQAKPEVQKNLFLNLKGKLNRGMECILPMENGKVLIGATTGLFLYDTRRGKQTDNLETEITGIKYVKDSREMAIANNPEMNFPVDTEIIRFEFATPRMSPSSEIEFSYILEGIDEHWSPWEKTPFKEFTHLRPGDYTFKVKSRNLMGDKGQISSAGFSIPPIWYQTDLALFIYFLGIIALITLMIYVFRAKIISERRKARLAAEKAQRLLKLEIEQLKLEKDKELIKQDKKLLEEDNIRKSKELANYTMMLVKKKDVFTETYENLQDFQKTLKTQGARRNLRNIIQKLNNHRIGEEYMKVFDVNFEKVHKNFFRTLKEINPDLTKRELRLCAFVKMDLTNKEIAPLLNISVRGVETARYRVRKKLDVQEPNFLHFLENLPVHNKEEIL